MSGQQITDITPDPKEPDLRIVFVNSQRVGRVRRSAIESLDLHIGKQVDDTLSQEILDAHQHAELRLRAIRSLSRASASRARLSTRLAKYTDDENALATVLDELAEEGVLDDLSSAITVAEELMRRGPVGAAKIDAGLRSRGFPSDAIDLAIRTVVSPRDPSADALQAAQAAFRGLGHLPHEIAARRLYRRLAARGFQPDDIEPAIESTLGNNEPSQRYHLP